MNPHFHTESATNIPLCHPASMISICHPTHSACWLLWPWINQTRKTAPNHWSRPTRLQYLRSQWNWVPLKARRHRTQPQMTIHFIPRVSLDGSIGILFLTKLLTPISADKYLSRRARPPHRRLHHDKEKAEHGDILTSKGGIVAAHLRGMRPAPLSCFCILSKFW